MTRKSTDVLVVGAGPVGLFCANELHRQGLSCRIIDKKNTLSDKSKALGLHIRSLDVLSDCGFLSAIQAQGFPVTGVLFKSAGKEILANDFSGLQASHPFMIDLPQSQTELILAQGLSDKKITIEWHSELTHIEQYGDRVEVTVEKAPGKLELIQARWLIACDGAHSAVRHLLNAEFIGAAYPQNWWLADLHVQWDLPADKLVLYISDKGPLACFPMGNNRYRLVMTAPKSADEDPSLDDIKRLFKQRASDPAELSAPLWLSQFSIHHRQIKQYRHDRVFFAGDAAHIHSPMGGQGLNTGLQDIYNLVWKLAQVSQGIADEKLLDTYHSERYPIGKEVLRKTHRMTKMILLATPLAIKLRNWLMSGLNRLSWVKTMMAKDLAELNVAYPHSPLSVNQGRFKGFAAGDYLPFFHLQGQSSLSIFHGIHYHLVLLLPKAQHLDDSLKAGIQQLQADYGHLLKIHLICPTSLSMSGDIKIWQDTDSQLMQAWGIKKPSLLLIRPDKYIGLMQRPFNASALQAYLQTWLPMQLSDCEMLVDA